MEMIGAVRLVFKDEEFLFEVEVFYCKGREVVE